MQKYDPTSEQEECFRGSVKELEKVIKQLAALSLRKEELTEIIIGSLDHQHEGQKTYEYGTWKIEVKTPYVYSLNKKLYESCAISLPDHFNPIKESKSYSIDKRLCEQYLIDAPDEVREQLIELIEKRPGKATISLKERV
jgi:hypothetical protein